MFFPFLFLFFFGCNERKSPGPTEPEQKLVPKETKPEFTGDVEKIGVEFRRILYEYEYPVPTLRKFFSTFNVNAKVLGVSLVKFLRIDPELWGLILEVFFRGWNYHVGAVLTFLCRNSASKCAVISEKLGATVFHRATNNGNLDPGEFGNVIASIHKSSLDELLPKILSDFDKTILWLNGEQNLKFSDRDVFIGILRSIIAEEFAINGFICLRILEKKNRFPNPQWIGAGELKLEGVAPSDIAKCQTEVLQLSEDESRVRINDMAHLIAGSATVEVGNAFATEFKKIIYTSPTARTDLQTFFLRWGEEAAKYILAEVLMRSVHIDSFLWVFVFREVLRQTRGGALTARLTTNKDDILRRQRDANNMSNLIVFWAIYQTSPRDKWWTERTEKWKRVYIEADGGTIHWDQISPKEHIAYWLNGALFPASKRINEKSEVRAIVKDIVVSQLNSNGAICGNILRMKMLPSPEPEEANDWDGILGSDILKCQQEQQIEFDSNPDLLMQTVDAITDSYLNTSAY